MSSLLPRWFMSLLVASGLSILAFSDVLAEDGRQGRLVSVSWLQKNMAEVLLLDASFPPQYAAGHIPDAISASNYGGQEPSRAAMEKRMQRWGINPGRKIVVYDKGGDWMAPRLFHDLYYYGVPAEDLYILDGGLHQWAAKGGVVAKDPSPPVAAGTFRITAQRDEIRARLPEFLVASGDTTSNALVDALDANYFYGAEKFFTRAGHVPNAMLMPATDFFNADKTFKSVAEIRRMAAFLGIKPEQAVYSHCGGGGAASVPWFALQFMAEHPKVKLYWESQREWLRDDRGLPFWTYAAPQLQRHFDWLEGWNAPMLRAFGVAHLNIVDVRSAEKYAGGHVPYAVNIPAETFRSHLGRAQQLADVLGPAGVNPAHEVVIMSESGLTTAAAVAFLALEQLGHKNVSVLMDTVDEWGPRGDKLTTTPTLVGMPKSAKDITVPAASYAPKPRTDVVVGKLTGDQGNYPTVLISSGKTPSSRTPGGKVIWLPYSEMLNPDGTPKAAKEIWKLINNAGVPRMAEVILFADDAAEAAVNYYIFRLMGWPDVKVWVN